MASVELADILEQRGLGEFHVERFGAFLGRVFVEHAERGGAFVLAAAAGAPRGRAR